MESKIKIDNKNTIVNFSNSILKAFGVPTYHDSIPQIDEIIKGHKKIVVMLFDGFGTYLRKLHLDGDSFLSQNFVHRMNATYPPTTVASTTGMLSARFPIENSWLGWRQYYEDLKSNILVFRGKDPDSDKWYKVNGKSIHYDRHGYDDLATQINKVKGQEIASLVMPSPIDAKGPKTLWGYAKRIKALLKGKDEAFLYVYNTQPDATIHHSGVTSKKTHNKIKRIDKFVKKLANRHQDTLFLVIADHGLVNVKNERMWDHRDLVGTFDHIPSLEGRTTTFFIKKNEKEKFASLFNKYYGDKFTLLTKEEALAINLFGEGEISESALKFIGDYIALATSDSYLDLNVEFNPNDAFAAHHAGYTKEEMEIDVSAINC